MILKRIKKLLEQAKDYHSDFVDINTWKSIIDVIFDNYKIQTQIIRDNNNHYFFDNSFANQIFNDLDSLPTLENVGEENLNELVKLMQEIFNVLKTNGNAKIVIINLKQIRKLLDIIEQDILPNNSTDMEDPEDTKDVEEPTNDQDLEDQEPIDDIESEDQ